MLFHDLIVFLPDLSSSFTLIVNATLNIISSFNMPFEAMPVCAILCRRIFLRRKSSPYQWLEVSFVLKRKILVDASCVCSQASVSN